MKNPTKKLLKAHEGNVLFIILLAVVLFAGLNFTVLKSQRSTSETGSVEQYSAHASKIIRFGADVKRATDLIISRGESESDLRYAHPDANAAYGTYGTTPETEIFHPSGGGAAYYKPNPKWLDDAYSAQTGYGEWVVTGDNSVAGVGTPTQNTCSSTPAADRDKCAELVLFLPYVKRELCIAINMLLNDGDETTTPRKDDSNMNFNRFAGTFNYINRIRAGSGLQFRGIHTYCIQGDSSPAADTYHFYQVLLAR